VRISSLIAERMAAIDSSGIRKVFDLASHLQDPINLSIGQPDFAVPDPVKAKAIQAIEEGHNGYTVTQGIPELCEATLAWEKQRTGIHHDSVLMTSGVSGGLLLAFMALINPGDKVIIPDPYFVMYKHLCRLLGGIPLYADTYPDFVLTPEKLDAADASDAKLLLLNSPCNPTGQVLDADQLREIACWADRHGVFIISDDIYCDFVYDEQFASIAGYTDNVLLLNGFSKRVAITGWRLGYAIGPQKLIHEMTKLQQFSFVCPPSIAQYAGMAALDLDLRPHIEAYKAKRDLIYEGLSRRFRLRKPGGAFYAFVEAPGGDGDAFVQKAVEHGVLVIPGSVFSERRSHFRVSFAAGDDVLARGAHALCSLCP